MRAVNPTLNAVVLHGLPTATSGEHALDPAQADSFSLTVRDTDIGTRLKRL